MRCILLLCLLSVFSVSSVAPAQTRPTTEPALWLRMQELNRKSLTAKDLVADFEQQKFTPLLKKPMVSTGTVKVRGSVMLWDTKKPSPTVMRVDEKGVSLYYPRQKTMEVFPIDAQLGALAASPLPDVNVLSQYFSFEQMPVKDLDPRLDETAGLAIRCTPINAAIAEHVEQVQVLLDHETGFLRQIEMTDADGERTVITFSHLRGNTGVSDADLALNVPEDTKVVRPLQNVSKP